MESFAGQAQVAPTTLAATHAALLRLAAGHGTVSLHVDVWDYQDDRPTRRRITWGATVFAPDGPGQPRLIASEHAAESPAAMLGAIAAQIEAHATAQSADVQALGGLPLVCGACMEAPCNCAEEMNDAARDDERSDEASS